MSNHNTELELTWIGKENRANIYRMRAFYRAYSQTSAIVSQAARQTSGAIISQAARQSRPSAPPEPMASLPWFHNVVLLESLKTDAEVFLSVDGKVSRWKVRLVDGLSASQAQSRFSISG